MSVADVTARAAASAAPTVGKHDAIAPVRTVGGVLSILVLYVVEALLPHISVAVTVITAAHPPAVLATRVILPGQLSLTEVADMAAASAAATVLKHAAMEPPIKTGSVLSSTIIVWIKSALAFPQLSTKFHVRTRVYPFGQPGAVVVTSLRSCIVGVSPQLSVAEGTRASAAVIASVSLHSKLSLSEPAAVWIAGGDWSLTVIICSHDDEFPEASVAV